MSKITATGKINRENNCQMESLGLFTKKGDDFALKVLSWYCAKLSNLPIVSDSKSAIRNKAVEILSSLLERIEIVDGHSLTNESLEKISIFISNCFKRNDIEPLEKDEIGKVKDLWQENGNYVSFYELISPLVPLVIDNIQDISKILKEIEVSGFKVFLLEKEAKENPLETQGYDLVVSSWKGGYTENEYIEASLNGNGFSSRLEDFILLKDKEVVLKNEFFHGEERNYEEIVALLNILQNKIIECNYNNGTLSLIEESKSYKEGLHFKLENKENKPYMGIMWNNIDLCEELKINHNYDLGKDVSNINFDNKYPKANNSNKEVKIDIANEEDVIKDTFKM